MSEAITYTLPGMHGGHCQASVREEPAAVPGVGLVEVDLDTKLVVVHGEGLDDARLRAAIEEAGYKAG
jgi:copper chaperone CopZ